MRWRKATTISKVALYSVYVIELSKKVFTENKKFRESNPQYNGTLQCLYVGATALSPRERLQQHLKGHRNARGHKLYADVAYRYGRYLRPSLYTHLKQVKTRAEAEKLEKELAMELRKRGYAVWFN